MQPEGGTVLILQERKDLYSVTFHVLVAREVKFMKPPNGVTGCTEVFEIRNTAKRRGMRCGGRVESRDRYLICINFKLR